MNLSSRWLVTAATVFLVLIAIGLSILVSLGGFWERWRNRGSELPPVEQTDTVDTLNAILTAELEAANERLEAERQRLARLLEGEAELENREQIEREIEQLAAQQTAVEQDIFLAELVNEAGFDASLDAAAGGPAVTEDPAPTAPPAEDPQRAGIDRTAELEQELRRELRASASRISSLQSERRRLERQLASAEESIAGLRRQLDSQGSTQGELQDQLNAQLSERYEMERRLADTERDLERINARNSALFQSSSIRGVFYEVDGAILLAVNPPDLEQVLRRGAFNVYAAGSGTDEVSSRVNVFRDNESVTYSPFPGYPEPAAGDWF